MADLETVHDTLDHTGLTGVGGGGINSGTSFPGSPSTDDLFHRTDLDEIYRYDGTRWLSDQIYEYAAGLVSITASSANPDLFYPMFGGAYAIWLMDVRWVYRVSTTHNATNYWTAELHKFDAGGADTVVTTLTTDKSSVGTYINPAATSIGASVTAAHEMLFYTFTKILSPGAFVGGVATRFRKIAT